RIPQFSRQTLEAWLARLRNISLSRRVVWGGVAGVAAIVAIALSFGAMARARIRAEAERRKLDVQIESVHVGWFSVRLTNVRARPRGVDGIDAQLDDVLVELGVGLGIKEVSARGGKIVLVGSADDLARRLREWRGERSGAPARNASRTAIRI